jgi:hypothetical protein
MRLGNPSAESSLLLAVIVSIVVAFVASRVPALAFGSFVQMVAILVAADLIVYLVMKIGLLSTPGD